jgi:hypothetical protein
MHNFPWMWVFFGMFFWMFLMRPRRLWACQGRGSADETRDPIDRPGRRGSRADLEGALAERDALIAKLEERVRVLERIATDDSARSRLREEIDRL